MTTPESRERTIGDDVRETPRPAVQPAAPYPAPREEFWGLSWAKAVWGGIQDTTQDVLDAGRKGASEAYDEGWQRFGQKTRLRRQDVVSKPRKRR